MLRAGRIKTEKEADTMGAKRRLVKAVVFTILTVIVGISSVIEADKRHRVVR